MPITVPIPEKCCFNSHHDLNEADTGGYFGMIIDRTTQILSSKAWTEVQSCTKTCPGETPEYYCREIKDEHKREHCIKDSQKQCSGYQNIYYVTTNYLDNLSVLFTHANRAFAKFRGKNEYSKTDSQYSPCEVGYFKYSYSPQRCH